MGKDKSSNNHSSKSKVEIETEVPIEVDITFDGEIPEVPGNQPQEDQDQLR